MHLYLIQSVQKFDAENFFRKMVVQPPKRLFKKKENDRIDNTLEVTCRSHQPNHL